MVEGPSPDSNAIRRSNHSVSTLECDISGTINTFRPVAGLFGPPRGLKTIIFSD